ncbi:MAG: hypothetical protein N3A57_08385, partial [Negativicutes bacterium]|nr:hypothetical protein [Negativicutes bacterium]
MGGQPGSRGSVVVAAVAVVAVIGGLAMVASHYVTGEKQSAENYARGLQAEYYAEAGLLFAWERLAADPYWPGSSLSPG